MAQEQTAHPYLDARREWDERYGDALARARNWRWAAFAALAVASIAVTGVAWLGAQSKVKPYVVAIDQMGNPIAMAEPTSGAAVNQRIIEAQVANWVWEARTTLPGTDAQKAILARVYALLGNQAAGIMDAWYKDHPPFSQNGITVSPAITSVLPVSANTWQVNWTETRFQNGQVLERSNWKANITTGVEPKLAEKPQALIYNPLCLFIQNLTWTQVLSQNGA
ncbi:MAG: VirB8/TrbF family protein [Thiobacillaceae bacterium]